MRTLIKNALIVNEGHAFKGHVLIENDIIKEVIPAGSQAEPEAGTVIHAEGLTLMPGMIDDQVHFREPGLTHKGDLYTEARAAVAGGITSYMEMPNTVPNTLT
ncbi:MAG: dihydroorotase, partial [Flavobacteriales bacterium]